MIRQPTISKSSSWRISKRAWPLWRKIYRYSNYSGWITKERIPIRSFLHRRWPKGSPLTDTYSSRFSRFSWRCRELVSKLVSKCDKFIKCSIAATWREEICKISGTHYLSGKNFFIDTNHVTVHMVTARKVELMCLKNRYGSCPYTACFNYDTHYDYFMPDMSASSKESSSKDEDDFADYPWK